MLEATQKLNGMSGGPLADALESLAKSENFEQALSLVTMVRKQDRENGISFVKSKIDQYLQTHSHDKATFT